MTSGHGFKAMGSTTPQSASLTAHPAIMDGTYVPRCAGSTVVSHVACKRLRRLPHGNILARGAEKTHTMYVRSGTSLMNM